MGMDLDTGGPKKSVRPVMNVAPLVDVVLVLLIIFMVITPLLTKQMTVTVPMKPDEAAAPNPAAEPQVVLWVGSDLKAHINKDVIEDADLATRLKQIFAARTDQTLFYDSHDDVPFGRTVQLIDIARGAGIASIAPLAEKLDDMN